MKTTVIWCLISTLILSLPVLAEAQTLPFDLTAGSGSTLVNFSLRADGTLLESGAGSPTLSYGDMQGAAVFLWYPAQSALRVGQIAPSDPVSNLGAYSVGLGQDCSAAGSSAFAEGCGPSASGTCSVALGEYSSASSNTSVAIGLLDNAGGWTAVALGAFNTASGYIATAIGSANAATGAWSVAEGSGNTAANNSSVALGNQNSSYGYAALATGNTTVAAGDFSAAFNLYTTATAQAATAFGQYNVGGGSASSWVATDPLFEIGNGTSASAHSDALVVYKNGNVTAQGVITAAAGGDIPMYTGN